MTYWHKGHVPNPEPLPNTTVQMVRLSLMSFPQKTIPFPLSPFSLLTLLAHRLQEAYSGHHAWQGRVPLLHTHGIHGSLRLPGLTAEQVGSSELVQGVPHQLCDSGQLTGSSAKGSSIRQGSYLQVTENDAGGCEQKWNLLKGHREAQTLQGSRLGTVSEIQPQSWSGGRDGHP